ncbi:kinesin-like protein KIN-12F [Citrus sinensis]|uniref:Kinesin-like protein KIN-12F n=1 Tax=Citrus sinensis TaxID=2711 RepID=A0ACB8P1P6_CITSI|nr:kinesin-like protein KIN-12F [Citrus sinensis]
MKASAAATSSIRNLLSKSLSSKQKSNSKISKSNSENTPPLHPNIVQPQLSPTPPPAKSLTFHSQSQIPRSDTPPEVFESQEDSQLKNRKKTTRSDTQGEVPEVSDPSVKVVVRIRPANDLERDSNQTVKKVSSDSLAVGERKFAFDSVLDSNSNQEDIFQVVGLPLVKNALAGYNVSLLSYGQTGSGKTYTMWGPPSAMVEDPSPRSKEGIVPRIFQKLFSEIQREQENSDGKQINYQCRCSFLEIYNEQIGDLLDQTQRNLEIKDDPKHGFYVENLTEEYVTSYEDITQILIKGLSSRKVGATSVNSKSSRSHIVFTFIVESWCKEASSKCFSSSKTSRICLVDIAGADRNKLDDVGRKSVKEGKYVKKSLAQLGDVGEILSTIRFGQRVKSIRNDPVINEISEDDVNDLSDQIRQLKEELIRAKSDVHSGYFKGRNVRESLNQLRVSLNRSLMLPRIDNELEEEVKVDEHDVSELRQQLAKLQSSYDESSKDPSENKDSVLCSSVEEFHDADLISEDDIECPEENDLEEIDLPPKENSTPSSDDLSSTLNTSRPINHAFRDSISISSCRQSPVLQDPTFSESPKIGNILRKSLAISSPLASQTDMSQSSKSDVLRQSLKQSEHIRSSLRSSKIFPGAAESLAASLQRGLQIIDSHQRSSASNRSSVAFSFEHLTLKPCSEVDKTNASVQTNIEERDLPLCASCRQKMENNTNEVQDSLKTWIVARDAENDSAEPIKKENELENICTEQAAKIEQLNRLVEKYERERIHTISEHGEESSALGRALQNEQFEEHLMKDDKCEIKEVQEVPSHQNGNISFEMNEKEVLLKEIESLRTKLQYTDASPFKSTENLRSSLLSRSIQLRKSIEARPNTAEELEKERERWTEMESEWICLTDELRVDIESSRRHAERVESELRLEKKVTEELDDALSRAVLGHARMVEHYADLQEKYNDLVSRHRAIMEGVAEVKRAAAKAGAKGHGSRFAKSVAAELSALRVERDREREFLKKENKSLKIQLRDTAEAVHAAGELLVRLKEAEQAASVAEANFSGVQQENEKLKKQIDKLKRKHKMEMITMKQYLAESKLPESALQPLYREDSDVAHSSAILDDDQAWRAEFGAIYQDPI